MGADCEISATKYESSTCYKTEKSHLLQVFLEVTKSATEIRRFVNNPAEPKQKKENLLDISSLR